MIKQVTINECTCENAKCGATWLSRSRDVPKVCPRCGNRKWNKSEVSGDVKWQRGELGEPVSEEKFNEIAQRIRTYDLASNEKLG